MDQLTQSGADSRDEITPSPAEQRPTSSITPSRRSSAQGLSTRPQVHLRPSTIRIRRLPSTSVVPQINVEDADSGNIARDSEPVGRRRSNSAPQQANVSAILPSDLTRQRTEVSHMPAVREDVQESGPTLHPPQIESVTGSGRRRRASSSARAMLGLDGVGRLPPTSGNPVPEYESGVVDLLDVVDPEVATLSTLTNVQNSLFVPDLGRFLNRQPTYELTRRPADIEQGGVPKIDVDRSSRVTTSREKKDQKIEQAPFTSPGTRIRSQSISSILSETRYAVLPHNVSLEGWSEEDKAELNDHVRHMLHSRRSKFKRSLHGFGKYIQKPLGFFVTLYAVLITLFGLAWVLFLIGWIYVGDRQPYIINIIDNVLVALFALNGDVLAPFRAHDTYHMIYIAHYHHLTWRLRKEKALPELQNENDLPAKTSQDADIESAMDGEREVSVLTPKQQEKLLYHQQKFTKSHSFYKPHETVTHTAFPLRLLVAVVVLLDCHSCFQIALGACTWGISYHVRPKALTAVILSMSISCNIAAGIVISIGDRITRKKDVIERLSRQALTEEAIRRVRPELAQKTLKDQTKEDPDENVAATRTSSKSEWSSAKVEDEKGEGGGEASKPALLPSAVHL